MVTIIVSMVLLIHHASEFNFVIEIFNDLVRMLLVINTNAEFWYLE